MPGLIKRKNTGELTYRWQVEAGDHIHALRWSPDGGMLAVAPASGPTVVAAGATGAVMHQLPGHGFGTLSIAWGPDSSVLASSGQDGIIRIWDSATGAQRCALEGGAAWVEHVVFAPDKPLLASAAGRQLKVWDSAGHLVRAYPPHPSAITDVQWRPPQPSDSNTTPVLATSAYGGVRLWNTEQPEPLQRYEWKGSTLVIAWSPDARHIATGDQDSTVHFWIMATGQDLQMWGYPTKVRELSWDPLARYLATGGGKDITIWDTGGKGPEGTRPLQLRTHEEFVSAVAYQHHGPLLASASTDGRVLLWHPGRQPRRPLAEYRYDEEVVALAWSPDDRLLATGTENGLVRVFETPPPG